MKKVIKYISWLLLLVILASGLFVFIYWVPDRDVDELKARWAPAPSQFVNIAGMQVHLRDEGPRGDPLPVLLIHGTSASLHTWEGWVEDLKQERRVISFDLPGFGLTGPDPNHDYSIENYAAVVIALLDHLKIDKVIVAGNSLGGNVAWTTALLHPQRIEKLVLVDSSGYQFEPESIPIGFKIATIPVLNQLMEKVLPRSVVESSVRNVYGDPSLVTSDLVDRYFDLTTRAGNRKALAYRLDQMRPGKYQHQLSELNLPTLILWGGKDKLIPLHLGERFHQDIKNSLLIVFEELGHVPQEENPEKTVAALKVFLAHQEDE